MRRKVQRCTVCTARAPAALYAPPCKHLLNNVLLKKKHANKIMFFLSKTCKYKKGLGLNFATSNITFNDLTLV